MGVCFFFCIVGVWFLGGSAGVFIDRSFDVRAGGEEAQVLVCGFCWRRGFCVRCLSNREGK